MLASPLMGPHTDLHIKRIGALISHRYKDEILRPNVVPYTASIGDDNSMSHHANLVDDFILVEGITRREWPACSPYMIPIQHAWGILGR
ncbi:transposable element Tcb2 transposase [Trichonephila clavata]|uniref:Transposable element Tcb2 transposase n=1 Tax=Trichonephila clavata TaxID=2740835 RepID=A0A8X6G7I8_TRICU|nr:transposable element Tcb2 transposase [Trichonephila clavata]